MTNCHLAKFTKGVTNHYAEQDQRPEFSNDGPAQFLLLRQEYGICTFSIFEKDE